MQLGPELILADAGYERRLHLAHRGLAGDDCAAHGQYLVGRFDQPGVFHHRLAIADGDAETGELGHAFRIEMVDRDAAVAAAMFAHEIGDAGRPARDAPVRQFAAVEINP